jgi:hypothetical protein
MPQTSQRTSKHDLATQEYYRREHIRLEQVGRAVLRQSRDCLERSFSAKQPSPSERRRLEQLEHVLSLLSTK